MAALGLIDTNPNSRYLPQGTDINEVGVNPNADYATSQGLLNQNQNFVNALQGQGGIGNQSNVFSQQQVLANQLQTQAMGGGPNPALNQLALTTGQNTQNQAALMAGQRGIGTNPGLAARQIAQQGAMNQQQAGGQAAVMRAQQQLAAQGQLGTQQANMANLATNQVGQQQGALNAANQASQNLLAQGIGANNAQNAARVGMQSNINNVNSAYGVNDVTQGAGIGKSVLGGIAQGVASGVALAGMAGGGIVHSYASGGTVNPIASSQPMSFLGQHFSGAPDIGAAAQAPMSSEDVSGQIGGPLSKGIGMLGKKNGTGEEETPGVNDSAGWAEEMGAPGSNMADMAPIMAEAKGGKIKGRAKVAGDSTRNDTVPIMASPGEVVIPRSITHDPQRIAHFLNGLLGYNLSVGKPK